MNILMTTKSQFKIRQSKIGLKETPTLKLGQTPVMTVPQVCVFGNLCRETTMPPREEVEAQAVQYHGKVT